VLPVSEAISGCRSLLELAGDTVFKLAIFANLRFAVGFLTISIILGGRRIEVDRPTAIKLYFR